MDSLSSIPLSSIPPKASPIHSKSKYLAIIACSIGEVAGIVIVALGAIYLFGPVGSVGFIASIAGGGLLVCASTAGIVWIAIYSCIGEKKKKLTTPETTTLLPQPSRSHHIIPLPDPSEKITPSVTISLPKTKSSELGKSGSREAHFYVGIPVISIPEPSEETEIQAKIQACGDDLGKLLEEGLRSAEAGKKKEAIALLKECWKYQIWKAAYALLDIAGESDPKLTEEVYGELVKWNSREAHFYFAVQAFKENDIKEGIRWLFAANLSTSDMSQIMMVSIIVANATPALHQETQPSSQVPIYLSQTQKCLNDLIAARKTRNQQKPKTQ